ncbi:hypothetical protein [Glutamicibacter sp. AOP5-A2-18]|uniref:hypothetical protein n=1 Tax=Glutamicibacter sp. AOP5-A2-18 TaxID=3457656 RepID=UPI004033EB0B
MNMTKKYQSMTPRNQIMVRASLFIAINVGLMAASFYQAYRTLIDYQSGQTVHLVFYILFGLMLLVFTVKVARETRTAVEYLDVTKQITEWQSRTRREGERP